MDNIHVNFGDVLKGLKRGEKYARAGWNGKGMHIELQTPDKDSKMKSLYIFMSPANKNLVPWVASQTDMLSEDWVEVSTA